MKNFKLVCFSYSLFLLSFNLYSFESKSYEKTFVITMCEELTLIKALDIGPNREITSTKYYMEKDETRYLADIDSNPSGNLYFSNIEGISYMIEQKQENDSSDFWFNGKKCISPKN